MSIFKKISLISLFAVLAGCYQPNTHGKFISEHKEAWINGYTIRIDEHKEADKGLVFCQAKIDDNAKAHPVCVKPEFKEKK